MERGGGFPDPVRGGGGIKDKVNTRGVMYGKGHRSHTYLSSIRGSHFFKCRGVWMCGQQSIHKLDQERVKHNYDLLTFTVT